MCVFGRAGKRFTAGHSQESLIWTGSAAAEVRGHRSQAEGSEVELSKPITGQRGAEGLCMWRERRLDVIKRSTEKPEPALRASFNHLANHDVVTLPHLSLVSHLVFHQLSCSGWSDLNTAGYTKKHGYNSRTIGASYSFVIILVLVFLFLTTLDFIFFSHFYIEEINNYNLWQYDKTENMRHHTDIVIPKQARLHYIHPFIRTK